jgi:uncharacterized protein DUF1698
MRWFRERGNLAFKNGQGKAAPAAVKEAPSSNALFPAYSKAIPSPQAALDIFKGHWKSKLPEQYGLQTGERAMFDDDRVLWGHEKIRGGLRGKSILELGPFEAYNSYQFQMLGAASVTAIEGNSMNFLKCLVLKQALGLTVDFQHGDFCEYLRHTDRRFDTIWASGVLYHQLEPLELLARIAGHSDTVFLWTHYYDGRVLTNHHRPYFDPEKNVEKGWGDFTCRHYYCSYNLPGERDIPLYFEGGHAPFAYWMAREDLFVFLRHIGLGRITIQRERDLEGLPVISLLAERSEFAA